MSDALHTWYSLRHLEALGAREAILRGEIELRRLTRLRDLLSADDGSVRASLHFRQRHRWLIIDLAYDTTLEVACQRCLEPLVLPVSERVELAVMEAASMEAHVPQGCEPFALMGGRLMPAELIEDELIVSLPIVPRHAQIEECGSLARDSASRRPSGGGSMSCSPFTSH